MRRGPREAVAFLCVLMVPGLEDRLHSQDCNGNAIPDDRDLRAGNLEFALPTGLPLGRLPSAIAAGDLDQDGRTDLVAADEAGTVSVFAGRDDGSFAEPLDFEVGGPRELPSALALGDLDGDGRPDIAVANRGTAITPGSLSILLQQEEGAFATAAKLTAGPSPMSLLVADLDNDGALDLVDSDDMADEVTVRRGDGNGSFDMPFALAVGDEPRTVGAADLDGDGRRELFTANETSEDLSVLWNLGEDGFSEPLRLAAGERPRSAAAGDIDGDGDLDLVAANFGAVRNRFPLPGSLSLFRNEGGRVFAPGRELRPGGSPGSVIVADMDGDGHSDLVVAVADAIARVLWNDGAGSFSNPFGLRLGEGRITSMTVADLDGDGLNDLAGALRRSNLAPGLLATVSNLGGGTFSAATAVSFEAFAAAAVAADIDGDEDVDLVAATSPNQEPGVLRTLESTGEGRFVTGSSRALSDARPRALVAADLDRDGKQDFATANAGFSNIDAGSVSVVLRPGGDNPPETLIQLTFGVKPNDIAAVDVDADGDQDLVTANRGSGDVSLLRNLGDGTFAPSVESVAGRQIEVLATGDFDDDGDVDLAVPDLPDDRVSILLNDGRGNFALEGSPPLVGEAPRGIAAGDLDGDGTPDLVTANSDGRSVSILLNSGGQGFGTSREVAVGDRAVDVALGDMDLDGDLDVAAAIGSAIVFLINEGGADFSPPIAPGVRGAASFVALEDINSDGVPEVLADGGFVSRQLSILFSTTVPSFSRDCNQNGVPDECDVAAGLEKDCNQNGILDLCETSGDCDTNGVPDECDIAAGKEDCNQNGVIDACETSGDCDQNGVPDECDIATGLGKDCNQNGIIDACETSGDCDRNGTPDSCELEGRDCNQNGILDGCEEATDCNSNGSPDDCDIREGISNDANADGIPDECAGMRRPGDANQDGTVDIADALQILNGLFFTPSASLPCEGGTTQEPGPGELGLLDWNGDGGIDMADPIGLLGWLFVGRERHALGDACTPLTGCQAVCDGDR